MKLDKKFVILGSLICIFLAIFIYILFFSATRSIPLPGIIPTPTPYQTRRDIPEGFVFSRFQKTVIGKTTAEEVEKLSVIRKEQLPDSTTKYSISSVDPLISDEVIVNNNTVIFEKTSTLTNAAGGFPPISEFLQKFGNPEDEIQGSVTHGQFATLFLYPNSGFVLIGNKQTNKIYEIQRFTPMTVNQYKNKYKSEIKTEWAHEE